MPIPSGEARDRATHLLAATDHYHELGHHQLAAESRQVAGLLLEAIDDIAAERSARQALQERCERQQDILGKATYQAMA